MIVNQISLRCERQNGGRGEVRNWGEDGQAHRGHHGRHLHGEGGWQDDVGHLRLPQHHQPLREGRLAGTELLLWFTQLTSLLLKKLWCLLLTNMKNRAEKSVSAGLLFRSFPQNDVHFFSRGIQTRKTLAAASKTLSSSSLLKQFWLLCPPTILAFRQDNWFIVIISTLVFIIMKMTVTQLSSHVVNSIDL